MTLQDFATTVDILASLGVIGSLFFLGYQIRQNTGALRRSEHNSAMEQWSNIRRSIISSAEVADLWSSGLRGERELSAAERLRLHALLAEHLWASFHVWERTERGILTEGTFEQAIVPLLPTWLATPGGSAWWSAEKHIFPPRMVADVDRALDRVLSRHASQGM